MSEIWFFLYKNVTNIATLHAFELELNNFYCFPQVNFKPMSDFLLITPHGNPHLQLGGFQRQRELRQWVNFLRQGGIRMQGYWRHQVNLSQ